jgi:molybdate transport repressor ModE-like protein/molybdopterin-binding protein
MRARGVPDDAREEAVTSRPSAVSSLDVTLLERIGSTSNVVIAARELGISRDRANYHLRRLARAFGGPVVATARGGSGHGGTLLTPLGDRIAHGGFDVLELLGTGRPTTPVNRLTGTYRTGPPPALELGGGLALRVAFAAKDGERVTVLLDPEAIVVARERFPSSARNVVAATVEAVRGGTGPYGRRLVVRAGPTRFTVAMTAEPVRSLGLVRGRRVYLYVKATALRRVGRRPGRASPGSPRS